MVIISGIESGESDGLIKSFCTIETRKEQVLINNLNLKTSTPTFIFFV